MCVVCGGGGRWVCVCGVGVHIHTYILSFCAFDAVFGGWMVGWVHVRVRMGVIAQSS